MKKGKILSGLIISLITTRAMVSAAECTKPPISDSSCPSSSTFYDSLRFEQKYSLDDYFYARGGTNYIKGLSYEIKEQCDYNNSSVETENGFFYTTDDLRNRKGVLPARTEPYWIITSNDYEVRKLPPQRNKGNLLVKYNVTYNVDGGDNKTHTECGYYEITRCGDGVLDIAGPEDNWESEQCDPNDPNHEGWGDGGCNANCKPVKKAVCNSTYNGQRLTNLTEGNHLCTEGTYGSFRHDTVNHKWTWKCNNELGVGVDCSATEPYCGDGIKDSGEQCDPADTSHAGWGNGGCDAVSCTPINVGDPVCNSTYNGQRLTNLTEGNHLCAEGTYSNFKYDAVNHKWTWKCNNRIGKSVDCSAIKPYCGDNIVDEGEECDGSDDCSDQCKKMYCGDGIRNNGEQCDPNDPNHEGRGPKGCNEFCEAVFDPDISCTQTFKKTLRCGKGYNFPDYFIAGGTDRWMYDFDVNFQEGSDLNGGPNPTFLWTDVLRNNNMLVRAGQTMMIIDSTPEYFIKNCPTNRSYENLYIEYTVTTAGRNPNGQTLPNAELSTHKECVYYDVSRCGDGVLDTDYGEECDPGSAGTSTLPDGRICNSDCKINEGILHIEKTLKDKIAVEYTGQELTWEIRVWAEGGDVTDFKVQDLLPKVLDYESYSVVKNTDNLTVTGPTGPVSSGNNNVYTWDVKGTLKSGYGHELVMEIKTKVNTVVKSDDNYRNIACVIKDGNEDCDNDIPPTPGKLKIEKELKTSNEITKTGDTVTWDIIVTVVDGDVTNFTVIDKLPDVLGYSGYMITEYGSLTKNDISEPIINGNEIEWRVFGTLKEGNRLVIQLTTYAKEMPEKDEKNVACVKYKDESGEEKEDCDDEPFKFSDLWIKKYILDDGKEVKEKTVKVGDEITYKILFGNRGDAKATITSIKDFLPKNVEYISSEIYIVSGSNSHLLSGSEVIDSNREVDGVYVDIYGGITLAPHSEGYIIIKGKILSDNQDYRTNFACIYLNDEKIDCDDATHNFETEVSCKPAFNPSSFDAVCVGDTSDFSTTVTCSSTTGAADLEILCDGNLIKTGHAEQITGTCASNVNDTDHKVQCKVNGSFTGTNGELCEGVFRRNTKSCGGGGSCFVAGTQVLMCDKTTKNIEDVEIGDCVLGEGDIENKVLGYDRPELGNRSLWSINGGDPFVSDEHPFKTTEGWKAIDPIMAKNEILTALSEGRLISDSTTEDLKNVGQLEEGDMLIKNDEKTEVITSLKKNKANADTQLYNFMLTGGNNTYYANGYLVHNKGGGGGGGGGGSSPFCDSIKIDADTITCKSSEANAYFKLECDKTTYYSFDYKDGKTKSREYKFDNTAECKKAKSVKCAVNKNEDEDSGWKTSTDCKSQQKTEGTQECFNVNAGNFSIEEGEIFPFYWNLHNMESWVEENKNADLYTEIEGVPYKNAPGLYDKPPSCDSDDTGKIAKNSMVCTFKIYHAGNNITPLYEIVGPCLMDKDANPLGEGLLGAWYKAMTSTYCQPGKPCYFSYNDKRDGKKALLNSAVYYIKSFGKTASLSLDIGDGGGDWGLKTINENSKPYGEYKIALEKVKYLECDGSEWKQKDAEEIGFARCESNFVLTSPYTVQKTPSGNLTASIKTLGNYKYMDGKTVMVMSGLLNAVAASEYAPNKAVDDAMSNFINKYSKLAVSVGDGLKKVPGKNIYFAEGPLNIGSNFKVNSATTIVQTKGNTTIQGNVDKNNLMLLTKGTITFTDPSSCNNRQTVKGIFYAESGIFREKVTKNTEDRLNKPGVERCTEGGLTIKGVLIGKGLDGVMENSRSNLKEWFGTTDKKGTVMNGASVLIEYSPSIFTKSTMPPGAEDFTTALSIYKN